MTDIKTVLTVRGVTAVSNIGDLFEALAVGWGDRDRGNRRLIASRSEGQFIRVQENAGAYPVWRKKSGDIPVVCHYMMTGFIRFESKSMFEGLFKTYSDDDNFWHYAELTERGFELATAGLLDFPLTHPEIKRCQFFNPKSVPATSNALNHEPAALQASQSPQDQVKEK